MQDNHEDKTGPLVAYFETVLKDTYDDFSEIIRAKIDLAKLDFYEIAAEVISSLSFVFIGLFGSSFLLIALALLIGEWLGRASLGFFCVGLIAVITAVLYFLTGGAGIQAFVLKKVMQISQRNKNGNTVSSSDKW